VACEILSENKQTKSTSRHLSELNNKKRKPLFERKVLG
jgi:hypothetical protein